MSDPTPRPSTDLARLTALVARLRAPDGCPWDREQTLPDLRAYLLEEAQEAAAALDSGDRSEGAIQIDGKMVERHPHVFGDGADRLDSAGEVREAWEKRKVAQREVKGEGGSILAGVSRSLPALVASYRLTQKAAGVGFDWREPGEVVAKLDEEIAELKELLTAQGADAQVDPAALRQRRSEEIGDLLFTVANLARHLEIDPEGALAAANLKFRRRFAAVEAGLAASGKNVAEATLDEMEAQWQAAKLGEKRPD